MAGKTIVLKGTNHFGEGTLGAAAYPGEAVELQADGNYDPTVVTPAEALKAGMPPVLIEDALQGKIVTTQYAISTKAFFYTAVAGDHLQVLVKDGETIAVGDDLNPEGSTSGLWVEAGGSDTAYLVRALEALSPSGANGLCSVVVL